nr:hypothetical protein [Sicyoidochytrium minutum DNA virus]
MALYASDAPTFRKLEYVCYVVPGQEELLANSLGGTYELEECGITSSCSGVSRKYVEGPFGWDYVEVWSCELKTGWIVAFSIIAVIVVLAALFYYFKIYKKKKALTKTISGDDMSDDEESDFSD